MQTITIKIKTFDKQYKYIAIYKILQIAKFLGIIHIGQYNCPKKIKKITVLRSPHIDKKSQEQFEIRNYKTKIICTIDKLETCLLYIQLLQNSSLFGVEIEIQTNFSSFLQI